MQRSVFMIITHRVGAGVGANSGGSMVVIGHYMVETDAIGPQEDLVQRHQCPHHIVIH